MAVQTISQTNSYNPGADLWVLAPLDESGSTQRLDWYLNFQIAKATFHQQKKLSEDLDFFIRECELQRYDYFPQGSEGLLISASHLLPVRWTLIQPVLDPFANWVEKIHFFWKSLQQPDLRVFLPKNKSISDFSTHWTQLSSSENYGLVLDS